MSSKHFFILIFLTLNCILIFFNFKFITKLRLSDKKKILISLLSIFCPIIAFFILKFRIIK